MPPQTRREAREQAARGAAATADGSFETLLQPTAPTSVRQSGQGGSGHYAQPVAKTASRPRKRRALWLTLGIVLVVVLALGVWLAFKVLVAKNELEAAQQTVGTVQDGGADAGTALADIGEHSAAAANAAADPVWRVAEFIPFAGDNLRAVRLAAESLDVVANDIAGPVLAAQASGEGGILRAALPVIESAAPTLAALTHELAAVSESSMLVGPVRSGVDQILPLLEVAEPALAVAPSMLGADGEKRYLMVFQNNAETLGLGGSSASQTLITANAGDLAIAAQADSGDFPWVPLDIEIDPGAASLYGPTYGERLNMSVTRPDWPSAAQMLSAFWYRDIEQTPLDGLLSLSPIGLARMLDATGPITVDDITLDSSNAVQILLSDSYTWWDTYTRAGAERSDSFFSAVSATMFDKVASGDFDLMAMVTALRESVDNGDLLLWSADAETQSLLEGGRIAGILPTDNVDQSTVGVYFRDTSASKIDYYMKSAIDVAKSCAAGTTTFSAATMLHLDIAQEAADALPRYVRSRHWGSSQFRTEVFVYGPPGTTFVSAEVDGRDVRPIRTDGADLGRPVVVFETFLRPGEQATVTAAFEGTGEFGPLELRSTPMINDTKVTKTDACPVGG